MQGRSKRGVLRTRAREDAAARRPANVLAIVVLDLAVRYLFQRNREVVLGSGVDHGRRKLVEGPLTEVVVVAVDLARALSGDDDTGVVGVDVLEQAVDARGDHFGACLSWL